MTQNRILAIGLDGYEQTLARELINVGKLPALAALKEKGATWLLDHGPATRTGLAWEHFSTGLSPDMANHHSAVVFDKETYSVCQQGTSLAPFISGFNKKSVIFDPPYFDLYKTSNAKGMVNWGAHDPGIACKSIPADLKEEVHDKFGPYPAKEWIYGVCWQSVEQTATMGKKLTEALEVRTKIAKWLLHERLPDWEFGLVVCGELHSATEGLWHGIDPDHPLHHAASAETAKEGLIAVYEAADNLISELVNTFPDATIVVFSMGGMGINHSDIPSMVLLPELLYRKAFKKQLMQPKSSWLVAEKGIVQLGEDESWSSTVNGLYPKVDRENIDTHSIKFIPKFLDTILSNWVRKKKEIPFTLSLDWMPATHYVHCWPRMDAFVLPSFYDGQIRVNLIGREKYGRVPLKNYSLILDEIEKDLLDCKNWSGNGVIEKFERRAESNALHRQPTDADLLVVWKGVITELNHKDFGRIGPVPYRRPGGHTGPYGIIHILDDMFSAGNYGVRSAFDVVPTIIDMLGERKPVNLSGVSLLSGSQKFSSAHV